MVELEAINLFWEGSQRILKSKWCIALSPISHCIPSSSYTFSLIWGRVTCKFKLRFGTLNTNKACILLDRTRHGDCGKKWQLFWVVVSRRTLWKYQKTKILKLTLSIKLVCISKKVFLAGCLKKYNVKILFFSFLKLINNF